MKFCTQCRYSKDEYVNRIVQTPRGPAPQSGKVKICTNREFFHPVNEEPLPCELVREDKRFCGWEAVGFEQRNKIELVVDNTPKEELRLIEPE